MPQQTDTIDAAFERLELLLAEAEQFADTPFTESDTRIKIIDTMLIEVLGWQKADILTEEQAGKGFLDYKVSIDGLAKAIVEAKRDARAFDLTNRDCGGATWQTATAIKCGSLNGCGTLFLKKQNTRLGVALRHGMKSSATCFSQNI